MSILSERLRVLRGNSSQADMARPLEITYQQWAKYERGEVAPGAEMLVKICRSHACSADWLLGLDEPSRASASVVASGNAVVAVGHNARASASRSAAPAPSCAKCPYKKKLLALEKLISKS